MPTGVQEGTLDIEHRPLNVENVKCRTSLCVVRGSNLSGKLQKMGLLGTLASVRRISWLLYRYRISFWKG